MLQSLKISLSLQARTNACEPDRWVKPFRCLRPVLTLLPIALRYVGKDHHEFHRALSGHTTLRELSIRADPEPPTRDDIEILMNALCSLSELRVLKISRIADYFNDDNISMLGQCLTHLENFYVGGFGVSDRALAGLLYPENLTQLTFGSLSRFTSQGISNFIEQLGPGNKGFGLSIESADPDYVISEEEQDALRELLYVKAEGRFEYQLFRGQLTNLIASCVTDRSLQIPMCRSSTLMTQTERMQP
jgi:hypothetical protein